MPFTSGTLVGNSRKTVSIIIPSYNQNQWLTDAVVSCIEQTHQPIEIIIVNDGSTDSTQKVAESLCLMYPTVKLINKKNGGLSSARNAGIKVAKGEYVACLDCDDKFHPKFLEITLKVNDDIVGVSQQEFGDLNGVWKPPFKHPTFELFKIRNCINCSSLFKREIFEKIGGYDESMKLGYEDWDFWIRATLAGYTVTCIADILFYYRKHGDSLVTIANKNHQAIRDYMNCKY